MNPVGVSEVRQSATGVVVGHALIEASGGESFARIRLFPEFLSTLEVES